MISSNFIQKKAGYAAHTYNANAAPHQYNHSTMIYQMRCGNAVCLLRETGKNGERRTLYGGETGGGEGKMQTGVNTSE